MHDELALQELRSLCVVGVAVLYDEPQHRCKGGTADVFLFPRVSAGGNDAHCRCSSGAQRSTASWLTRRDTICRGR
eukprot:6715004-Alexandrium_andersonii.AAC.1